MGIDIALTVLHSLKKTFHGILQKVGTDKKRSRIRLQNLHIRNISHVHVIATELRTEMCCGSQWEASNNGIVMTFRACPLLFTGNISPVAP
mgnify:CR=1 FL=1